MKKILIFAGTTEGRTLSEALADAGIPHTVCVATPYGEIVLKEHSLVKILQGRKNMEEIRFLVQKDGYEVLVDATHPYAKEVSKNIKTALSGLDVTYIRLKREELNETVMGFLMQEAKKTGKKIEITRFEDHKSCEKALRRVNGNILLTTGTNSLDIYCKKEELKNRLYVRVLPCMESITKCMEQGIAGKQIIAMQGPFSAELNAALLREYQIQCLVTKESGKNSGYQEKLEAALMCNIPVYVVSHLSDEEGAAFEEVLQRLEECCGLEESIENKTEQEAVRKGCRRIKITLAGAGMGSEKVITKEVQGAIDTADILLGAERIIAPYEPGIEKKPYYLPDQVLSYLKQLETFSDCTNVVILFSGDTGFYSGCRKLYQALQSAVKAEELNADIRILPGISSVAYLAACLGESYQDAAVYSMHGKDLNNLAAKIKIHEKTFLLMSGVKDMHRLGKCLTDAGLKECEIWAGYQFSQPEETLYHLTPEKCQELNREGLYTCFIRNSGWVEKRLTHGHADDEFLRDKVPMTKEELREISICKLRLHRNAIVYDIGSGTGSIAVEIAGLSDSLQVYAVEHKKEAAELMEQNRQKFRLDNMKIIEAEAPEGLAGLPAATHAFIGGSKGRLVEILNALYRTNPHMRIVINAVTLETIEEIQGCLRQFPIEEEDIVQIQVSRTRKAGSYHLMQAENPVQICAFTFKPKEIIEEIG